MTIKNSELNEIITQIFEIHEKIIGNGNTLNLSGSLTIKEIIGNEKANQAAKKAANFHNK